MTRQEKKMIASGKIYYTHFKIGSGYATVAVARGNEFDYYGVAYCSPVDQFCRKTGREIAYRNLFTNYRALDKGRWEAPFKNCCIALGFDLKFYPPPWARNNDKVIAKGKHSKNKSVDVSESIFTD